MTQSKYIEKGDCHVLIEDGKIVMSCFSKNYFNWFPVTNALNIVQTYI